MGFSEWFPGAANVASNVFGMATQRARDNRAMQNQERLMGIQHRNQKSLNEHGAQLQYDFWKKTNYKAQVDELKEAGLSTALIYGQGGPGGITGSQGGGSAAAGSAPNPMGIEGTIAMANAMADIKVKNAQAEELKADAELKKAETTTEGQRAGLTLQQGIKAAEEISKLSRENRIGDETEKAVIKGIALDVITKEVNIKLSESKTELNAAEKRELINRIYQNWIKTGSGAIGDIYGS